MTATERDHDECQRCHEDCGKGVTSRHHRQNRQANNTIVSNLIVLGGTGTTGCHGWVTSHPEDALEEGWTVPSWADPHDWPSRRQFHGDEGWTFGWVLLDDAGHVLEITEREAMQRMGRVF